MEPDQPLGPPELPRKDKPVQASAVPSNETDQEQSKTVVAPTTLTKSEWPQESDVQAGSSAYDESDDLNEHVEIPGDPDGIVAAEEEQKWQAEHPAPQAPPEPSGQPKKRRHGWLTAIIIVAVLAAATAGAYWYGSNRADKDNPKPAQSQQTGTASTHHTTEQQTQTVATKHYDSTNFTLGFDYPQTWKVADATDKLTITSPELSLATMQGTQKNVHAVVTMQNPGAKLTGFPADGAMAALLSQKLTYKQPSSVQRAQTYLSYLGYASQSGLDGLFITGDSGYQQGQLVPLADVNKGDPTISVTFQTCASSDCASGTPAPVTLKATGWTDTDTAKQINTLLQSIVLD